MTVLDWLKLKRLIRRRGIGWLDVQPYLTVRNLKAMTAAIDQCRDYISQSQCDDAPQVCTVYRGTKCDTCRTKDALRQVVEE